MLVIDNDNHHIFVTRYHDTLAYWISKHAVVTITRNLGGPAIVRKTGIKVTIFSGQEDITLSITSVVKATP